MTRLIRFVALTVAVGLTISGLVTAFTVVGVGLYRNTASAQAVPLPPLSSPPLGGSTVYASDGRTVLGVLHASETRRPVSLSRVAKVLVTAVLDTEDHRFFQHGGFDIPSTVRALAADSSSSGGLQGGSTIAQQLVKQTYLSPARKISRKIKEAVLADRLERLYSKDQILQAYLNTIYLGNGAYGVEAAANAYFDTDVSKVTLPEAALLAGLIQNPSGYDPIFQPVAARARRAEVLSRMLHYRDITPAQAAAANATPLPTATPAPPSSSDRITDYYLHQVEAELLGHGSPLGGTYDERYAEVFEGGLKIYTNLDPTLQAEAEQTVAADTPSDPRGFQEGLVAIDPTTGKVRALVGGTGGKNAQFDIMIQGRRQPGSGFKLFTLLAALQQGYSIYDTLDGQSPCAIDFPTDHDLVTHPANNDEGAGGGVLTLLNATAQSTNCAFIRLAHEVGLSNVIAMAHQLGISEALPPYPSIVIGSIPVHPIEMAAAYAAVADDGVYHAPSFVDHIIDRSGSTIYTGGSPGRRVVPAQIAREATVAFQAVIQNGTGTAGGLNGREAAGKTGTTNSYYDAWFNGYTPQLETTVWMGNPNTNVSMVGVGYVGTVYGGTYPTFTWRDFMDKALASQPAVAFQQPDYNSLPAPVYITSPGLVRDDVLDHNYVYVPPPTPAVTTPAGGATAPYAPTPSTAPPATPAVTSPTTAPGKPPHGGPPAGRGH